MCGPGGPAQCATCALGKMPSKRPAPLSDAFFQQGPPSDAELKVQDSDWKLLGETNDGVPLPVKNTFIDVNTASAADRSSPGVNTAPAELTLPPGFIKKHLDLQVNPLANVGSNVQVFDMSTPRSAVPELPAKPRITLEAPGTGLPNTPLVTPSPTAHSRFAATRYQLFGGPEPVQEVADCPHVATAAHGVIGIQKAVSRSPAPGVTYGSTYSRPAAAGAAALQLDSVEQGACSGDEDDGDDDSEDGEPSDLAALAKALEDAPRPPPDALHPSLGSQAHDEGTCKRCCFFPRNRCLNGYKCDFCHYDHEKRKRKSKKKKRKDKDKVLVPDLIPHLAECPATVHAALLRPQMEVPAATPCYIGVPTWDAPMHVPEVAPWFPPAEVHVAGQLLSTQPLPAPLYATPMPAETPPPLWTDGFCVAQGPPLYEPSVGQPTASPTVPLLPPSVPPAPLQAPSVFAEVPETIAQLPLSAQASPPGQARGPLPPPLEAPKLPQALQLTPDLQPPPQSPRLGEETPCAPRAPPPVQSPKLPQSMSLALQVAVGTPPVAEPELASVPAPDLTAQA